MRYKITYAVLAQLVDHDGAVVSFEPLKRKLDGLTCHSDSVLNYTELSWVDEGFFRGGHPRLILDGKGQLLMSVDVDSQRKLTRIELSALRQDFAGQLTDGIGAGCFDELTATTGVAVELRLPLRAKCTQIKGTAWRPKTSTEKGNAKRIAAAATVVEKLDAAPHKTGTSRRQATAPTPKVAINEAKKKPNLKTLFRLLAKPERDQLFNQIKDELEACGNDLSMVSDGEYPYGNFNDPKLLRLLLKAGLPPETIDLKGNSLLIQAAVNPKCLELLLKNGADVNRVCDSYVATTALIRAASLGKRMSVKVLLEHGADPTTKNKSGKSAVDIVDKRSRERQTVIDLLRSAERT